MRSGNRVLVHLACFGLAVSGFQAAVLPAAGQEGTVNRASQRAATSSPQASPQTSSQTSSQTWEQAGLTALPDSPGAIRFPAQDQATPQDRSQPSTAQPSPTPPVEAQTAQPQSQSQTSPAPPQKPVGTAAAETPNASGIAASQPAGVAIAPAKQRRVRTIVLRTGAIIGASVAIGTVVALSRATSSKPPGAH
jgi:hypothetical protein